MTLGAQSEPHNFTRATSILSPIWSERGDCTCIWTRIEQPCVSQACLISLIFLSCVLQIGRHHLPQMQHPSKIKGVVALLSEVAKPTYESKRLSLGLARKSLLPRRRCYMFLTSCRGRGISSLLMPTHLAERKKGIKGSRQERDL